MEGGAADRPAWLNLAVHVVNSLVAWLDLLIGERQLGATERLCGTVERRLCDTWAVLACVHATFRRPGSAPCFFAGGRLGRPRVAEAGCRRRRLACSARPAAPAAAPAAAAAVHCLTCPPTTAPPCAVEERSFEGSSRHLALLIAVAYCTWLLVVRQRFGKVGGRARMRVDAHCGW